MLSFKHFSILFFFNSNIFLLCSGTAWMTYLVVPKGNNILVNLKDEVVPDIIETFSYCALGPHEGHILWLRTSWRLYTLIKYIAVNDTTRLMEDFTKWGVSRLYEIIFLRFQFNNFTHIIFIWRSHPKVIRMIVFLNFLEPWGLMVWDID